MKKALTLALAVTMLISILMFTSCDVSSIMEMLGGDFGSETTPPASKRYTVTEDEKKAILNSTNYTWISVSGSSESVFFVSDNAIKQTIKQDDINYTAYLEKKNGKAYQIIDPQHNGQWVVAEEVDPDWNRFSLGQFTSLEDSELLERIQYNEATKSYIFEENGTKAEFYFEDGKLIRITVAGGPTPFFVIENVGTTVVTLPEYTFAEK